MCDYEVKLRFVLETEDNEWRVNIRTFKKSFAQRKW